MDNPTISQLDLTIHLSDLYGSCILNRGITHMSVVPLFVFWNISS